MGLKRIQTAEEIGEVFGVNEQTVRRWTKDGAPHSRRGRALAFNDGEIQEWLARTNRKTTPGRPPEPKAPPPPDMEGDKDYWLARKYKIQALEAEGELLQRDAVRQLGASVVGTFRNSILGLPAKLAVQLEGLSAAERQEIIQAEFTHLLDELARRLRELGAGGNTAKAA